MPQFVFHSKKVTLIQLLKLLSHILDSFDHNLHVDSFKFVSSKGFDSIPCQELLFKLRSLGIPGDLCIVLVSSLHILYLTTSVWQWMECSQVYCLSGSEFLKGAFLGHNSTFPMSKISLQRFMYRVIYNLKLSVRKFPLDPKKQWNSCIPFYQTCKISILEKLHLSWKAFLSCNSQIKVWWVKPLCFWGVQFI